MTEQLYTLPNGNAIPAEDVQYVGAYDTGITVKFQDGSTSISPSDDPPRDRDALIAAVNAARARQAERDQPAPAFIVLTDRRDAERRIINRDQIMEVSPLVFAARVFLARDDFFTTVETFAEVAAMLGVTL